MPQDTKQPAKKTAQPSSSFLQKMFGPEKFSPEMEEGIGIARKEMPNMAPVQPYGFFSRLVNPNALAYVSSGSNIYLNPRTNEGQTPQEIADTLTHEQEHIKQKAEVGPFTSFLNSLFPQPQYSERPDEMAAFQAEKDRRNRMNRPQTAVPSFGTDQFYVPRDINLPLEKYKPLLQPTPQNKFKPLSGPVTMSNFRRLPNQ